MARPLSHIARKLYRGIQAGYWNRWRIANAEASGFESRPGLCESVGGLVRVCNGRGRFESEVGMGSRFRPYVYEGPTHFEASPFFDSSPQVPQFTVSPTPLPGYEQAGGEMMDTESARDFDLWDGFKYWIGQMPTSRPVTHSIKIDRHRVEVVLEAYLDEG